MASVLARGESLTAHARSAEYRCEQIVALEIDFLARHRVVAGAAHGFCVVAQFATVLQRDFDDALAARHGLGQRVVAEQRNALAQRQHFGVAHAFFVV